MAPRGSIGRLRAKVAGSLRRRPRSTGAAPGADEIVVSYAPERDGEADPGEVVWAWVSYEDDPTQGKDRPVLVLGHEGERLVGVPLSSKDRAGRADADEWVPVGRGAWDREGRESYADAARVLRLHLHEVRREGAALARDRFDEVLARVRRLHAWPG